MDIRRFFGGLPAKNNNAGSSKNNGAKSSEVSEVEKSGKNKKREREKKDTKRKSSSKTSESDETPAKETKKQKHRKKVIDSDSSEEEPLPPKLRKTSSETSKSESKVDVDVVISSDEEAVLPTRLNKKTKNISTKGKETKSEVKKSPAKTVKNVYDYFGDKPVERSFKSHASKRKQRSEDTEVQASNGGETSKSKINMDIKPPEDDIFQEQPLKKAKKSTSETKLDKLDEKEKTEKHKSPSKTPTKVKGTPTKSDEIDNISNKSKSPKKTGSKDKDETSSKPSTKTKQTPTKSERTLAKTKKSTEKLSSPVKPSPKKSKEKHDVINIDECEAISKTTPAKKITPDKDASTPDVVPSSLERKASGYRSFMAREGPRALGSKEIPKGSETCLGGLVFVVTGVLESIEREDAQDLIRRHGGKVTQSVSKKTSYVVMGRDPGESKIEKAKKVGTKQLDEEGLFDLIRKSSKTTETSKTTNEKGLPTAPKSYHGESESQTSEDLSISQKQESQNSMEDNSFSQKYSQSSAFSSARSSPSTQTPSASPLPKGDEVDSLLWVDKYSPKRLKDIIGQQGDKSNVNKLSRWLQNWHNNLKRGKPKTNFFAAKEDGSIFKAALLSGPPGVGKTTSAQLVCKELGYSFVEFNASDSRSKKTLEQLVSEVLGNRTIDGFLSNAAAKSSSEKHVLIMDEVDGMAGNEDRGGMQELISLIKSTKIPIICMCNDRNSQKVRSLANYCFDLRFQRPRVEQIKGAMMRVAFREKFQISPQAMEKIVMGANQDVRQVLYNLCMWTSKQKSINYDEAKHDADRAHKDIKLGPFDVTRKIFSSSESSKMNSQEYFSLFFNDYSLIPLFSQENYLQVVPYSAGGDIKKILKSVSEAADSFCDSDLVDKSIRSKGSWNLLPLQSFFSCVLPGKIMKGGMSQKINFPSWLGKNSTTGKNSRLLQDLLAHTVLSISGSKNELNLDYIPHLRNSLTRPLVQANSENCSSKVSEVIKIMDNYHLVKEDWESVIEIGYFAGGEKLQSKIDSKVKSAFTRAYNKESHMAPYSLQTVAKKNRGKTTQADDDLAGIGNDGNDDEENSDEDSIEKNPMIKVKKSAKTAAGKGKKAGSGEPSAKTKTSRGKGKGKNK